MSSMIHICDRCKMSIAFSEGQSNLFCPHCGWSQSLHKETPITKQLVGVTFILALLLGLSLNWGKHVFSAVPLQAKTYLGMASESDYASLAQMCRELQDASCVQTMLSKKVDANPSNLESIFELGKVQVQLGMDAEAVKTLHRYLVAGGDNLEAKYHYAKALSRIGQIDLASQAYKEVLAAKPNVLQITVAQNYIKMLISNGRTSEAKKMIEKTQKSGDNARGFMDYELRKIASIK